MTQEEVSQIIKETVSHAKNSLLDENSNLVDMIVHKMEGHIEKSVATAIEKNVNGKIRGIDQKIDDYIKGDLKWKDSVTPSIDTMKMLSNTSTGVSWILKSVIILGGAVGVVYGLLTWLRR